MLDRNPESRIKLDELYDSLNKELPVSNFVAGMLINLFFLN